MALFERFVTAHPEITDPRERWQIRTLAILILVAIAAACFATILLMYASSKPMVNLIVGSLSTVLLGVAYLLVRSKAYRWAGPLVVVMSTVASFFSALLAPYDDSILLFFCLGSLAGAVLLEMRPAIGAIILNTMLVILLPILIPEWTLQIVADELAFMVTFSTLVLLVLLLRRRDVEALVEQQRIYHALFEQTNDAVFIMDMESRYIDVNKKACDMLGYTRDELLGMSVRDTVVPEEYPNSEKVLLALLNGEKLLPYERTFRRKDGRALLVEINVELARDARGEPVHIQSIARDLSRRKVMEKQALALALEKERGKLLRVFITNISHDLKTPLTSANTSIYLLRKVEDAQKRSRYLDTLEQSVQHLTILVDAMVTMMRLDMSDALEMEPVSLNPLIAQTADRFRTEAWTKELTIDLDLAEPLPFVYGDAAELTRMLEHLVSNAIQHSSKGDSAIKVQTQHQNERVLIILEDHGKGIAPEDLGHIFERFYRGGKGRNQQTGGSGLGLAIIKKIVEAHQGYIAVESAVGQGTTFRVSLPIHNAADKAEIH